MEDSRDNEGKRLQDPISRRYFLKKIAVAGGLTVAGSTGLFGEKAFADVAGRYLTQSTATTDTTVGGGQPAKGTIRTKVAVIGAGLAGLAAARDLVNARTDVVVLEARDRVGGRTLNHSIGNGKIVEVGGQWIGPTQDRIRSMAAALGEGTFPTYDTGQYVDYRNGMRFTYTGRIPISDPSGTAEAAVTMQRLDMMAKEVPLDAPYKAQNALAWDSQSFQTWIDSNLVTPGGKSLIQLATEAVFAAEPRDLSLLHVLFYIHSAGTLENLVNTTGGAQQERFIGGSQRVSILAAKWLGDRVHLSSPVQQIIQHGKGVTVEGNGFTVQAERVIVAIPPTLAGRIRYSPILPPLHDQLFQRLPMGTVIKVQCVYDTPFWRSQGLAGQATSDTGPVKITYDNSPVDGSPGVLMGFIEGEDARKALKLTPDQRQEAVVNCFVRYFGDKARHPQEYIEKSWAEEEYTRGCYGGFFPTGVWTSYGEVLREPFGRIHWAGSETSTVWNGYMDGAVRSGERAAAEVLKLL